MEAPKPAPAGEPLEGNSFVAVYPPFSLWSREEVAAVAERWSAPPPAAPPPFGLYVHVPYCEQRCQYCYYRSYADREPAEHAHYVALLARELAQCIRTPRLSAAKADFVYFGGGTPSLLEAGLLRRLLALVERAFPRRSAAEVSFECAPRSATAERLSVLRDGGVSRLSLGIQALDDRVLQESGRVHQVADVERAYAAIRRHGFDHVNVDLIVGLPGETEESFFLSLERVIGLQPESVTLYPLEVPPNTPLAKRLRGGGAIEIASWPVKRERLGRAFRRLEERGYTLRSAYAAVRDPARHRFLYQDLQYRGADVVGVGVSAFSYLDGVHYQNHSTLRAWTEALEGDTAPHARARVLRPVERAVRELVLQLKLGRADVAPIERRHGLDPRRMLVEPLARLASEGLLTLDDRRVSLTRQGLLQADRLVRGLYLLEHRDLSYW